MNTEWPGRSPDLIEDQITYPIISAMLAAPHVSIVRGSSDYGFSYVYVIFDEGTDIYWGRTRVLEYMSKITGQLPEGVSPKLGPDATGVGWAFQYALVDKTGQNNLQQMRSFNDWYLRYWLSSVSGVAEVATIGGFVKQYQVAAAAQNQAIRPDIPLGYYTVRRAIEDMPGFPPARAEGLLHIILAHHGQLEHGSPVVPCTREATLVHMVDNLGGKLGSFDRLEKALADGERWSGFDRALSGSAYFASRDQAQAAA